MDGRSSSSSKNFISELRSSSTLIQIVVSSSVITLTPIVTSSTSQIRSQSWRSVRTRDQHHSSTRDQRSCSSSSTRTRSTQNTNDAFISDDCLSSSLTTIRRTKIIQPCTNIHTETMNVAIISNSHINSTRHRHT